jgi:hypothetical protein
MERTIMEKTIMVMPAPRLFMLVGTPVLRPLVRPANIIDPDITPVILLQLEMMFSK